MGNLRVGYEALDWAAAEIKNSAVAIEDELRSLASKMPKEEQWGGAASASFLEARTKWESAMQDMKEILNDISLTVGLSKEEYASAEAANAKRFQ